MKEWSGGGSSTRLLTRFMTTSLKLSFLCTRRHRVILIQESGERNTIEMNRHERVVGTALCSECGLG